MDIFDPWPPADNYHPNDLDSVSQELHRLQRALRVATICYLETKKELDNARDVLGFYKKPLQFSQFPREVRDQIYRYALQAPLEVQPEQFLPAIHLRTQRSLWKPPCPGLCRVNKQIWSESRVVLYSENRFSFRLPSDMLRFEEQIGTTNRGLVHRLGICCMLYPHQDPLGGGEEEDTATGWAEGLQKSKLSNIAEMNVSIEALFANEGTMLPLRLELQQAIEGIFGRTQNEGVTPLLTLKGFQPEEREKFPKHWKIKVEQWFNVEEIGSEFDGQYLGGDSDDEHGLLSGDWSDGSEDEDELVYYSDDAGF